MSSNKPVSSGERVLSTRKIVISGVLAAIAILLGVTRLGFIPVPNASGNATIMHVPAIIGGIMEGPVVGGIIGTIFGIFSFLQATTPLFKDPLVAILPRIFIGITAFYAYAGLKKAKVNEYISLVVAGLVGTFTNTFLVLGMAVLRKYLTAQVALTVIVTNALFEAVVATIITVAVVAAWKRIETGTGKSKV